MRTGQRPKNSAAWSHSVGLPSTPPQGSLALDPGPMAGDFCFMMRSSPGMALSAPVWTPAWARPPWGGGWNRKEEVDKAEPPCSCGDPGPTVTRQWRPGLPSVQELLEYFPPWSRPEAVLTGPVPQRHLLGWDAKFSRPSNTSLCSWNDVQTFVIGSGMMSLPRVVEWRCALCGVWADSSPRYVAKDLRMVKYTVYCTCLCYQVFQDYLTLGFCLFQDLGVITTLPSSWTK